MKNEKIAIIGAGIAGLSAAIKLIQAGFKVDVFEARGFIGGRTYSFLDKLSGDEIDNGQHIMMGAYKNFFELLEILGTKHLLDITAGISINYIDLKGGKSIFDTTKFSRKLGLIHGFFKFNLLSKSEKFRAIKFLLKVKSIKIEQLHFSVEKFLVDNYQSKNLIKVFWEPLCIAVMNLQINQADAGLFANVIKIIFFGPSEFSKLVFSKMGLSTLLEPAIRIIKDQHSNINLNSKIIKLNVLNNNIVSFETQNQKHFYDYYISAVPFNSLINLFNQDYKVDKLFSTILSAYLWFENDIKISKMNALINSNIQWVFNRSTIIKTINSNGHLTVTISSANKLNEVSNDKILEIIVNELNIAFPELKKNKLINSKIIKDRRATMALSPENLYLRNKFSNDYSNLFVIGDWTNTGLPATIESACLSGFRIAERLINSNFKKNI